MVSARQLAIGLVAGLVPGLVMGSASGAGAPPTPRLPDLRQELPQSLNVEAVSRPGRHDELRLGFRSAARNYGPGSLVVRGRRRAGERWMTADQVLRMSDGSRSTVSDVGRLRFVSSSDHDHWHFVRFERYELRRADDFGLIQRDRKTGFCLGDRYDFDLSNWQPHEPARPVFTSRCGLGERQLTSITEGISPGYADDYGPQVEGQFIDITGLPAGRYVLTHRVNPARRIRESRYRNNASSLLLRLRAPTRGQDLPRISVLSPCPGRARCS